MMATRIIIEGEVQGVGYRIWMLNEAIKRGLRGWVRNRSDGSVEAVVIGEPEVVDRLVAVCRKGPHGATVTAVALEPARDPIAQNFAILPDA